MISGGLKTNILPMGPERIAREPMKKANQASSPGADDLLFGDKLGEVDRSPADSKPVQGRSDVSERKTQRDNSDARSNDREASSVKPSARSAISTEGRPATKLKYRQSEAAPASRTSINQNQQLNTSAISQPGFKTEPDLKIVDESVDSSEAVTTSSTGASAGSAPAGSNDFFVKTPMKSVSTAGSVSGAKTEVVGNSEAGASATKASDETLAILDAMKSEQGDVRKKAMDDFLSRMQSEFGIGPDRVLEAFSRMDEQSLMAPPEESTEQFLSKLELKPQEQPRAAQLYKEMLHTTGEAALNEKLIGLESGVNLDVVSPRDQALRQLNQSIDDLNASFARKPVASLDVMNDAQKAQFAAEQMDAQLAKMMLSQRDQAQAGGDDDQKPITGLKSENAGQQSGARKAAFAALAGAGAVAAKSTSTMSNGADQSAVMSADSSAFLKDSTAFNSGLGSDSTADFSGANDSGLGGEGKAAETAKSDANLFQNVMPQVAPNASGNAASDTKLAKKAASSVKSASVAPSAAAGADPSSAMIGEAGADSQLVSQGTSSAAKAAGPAGMMMNSPQTSAQDEQENVRELIRQAQIVLKKGGGEMKMDLKPEGIGQVKLKISVEDGQVNIQMLTDNDASKRLLEKGLHELKSNLAAHELKVDTMKVDVGQDVKKHMDSSADEQSRQNRQHTSDIMGQMRDEREAFRQGMMGNMGWKSYGRQERGRGGQSDSVRGESAPAAIASTSKKRPAGTSRLDLVA